MTATKTVTITRRSRMGFSWTNTPEQRRGNNGESYLAVGAPANEPSFVGTPKQTLAEFRDAARINNGNFWRSRFFVLADGEYRVIDAGRDEVVRELDWLCDGESDAIELPIA